MRYYAALIIILLLITDCIGGSDSERILKYSNNLNQLNAALDDEFTPVANEAQALVLIEFLERNNWNISAAARELGNHRNTVRHYMKVHNIKKPSKTRWNLKAKIEKGPPQR